MPTTDHPLVLDLGLVRGIATTSGEPSSSEGSEGELRIDTSNGKVWKRTSSGWTLACTFAFTANWTQSDSSKPDYIKNKPTISNTIASGGTNLVPAGAIFSALGDRIPERGTRQLLSLGEYTSSYDGYTYAYKWGPLSFVYITSANTSESVWTRNVRVGNPDPTYAIGLVPDGFRPKQTQYVFGRILTAGGVYRAEFSIHSNAGESLAGQIHCDSLFDSDWVHSSTTSLTATGFRISCCYINETAEWDTLPSS